MNIIGWVWHDDAAAVIENLFCPADTTGHLFSELALTDGLSRLEDLLGQSDAEPEIEIDEREEDEPDEELGAFVCSEPYWKHALDPEFLSWEDRPFLRRLCNGDLVKL